MVEKNALQLAWHDWYINKIFPVLVNYWNNEKRAPFSDWEFHYSIFCERRNCKKLIKILKKIPLTLQSDESMVQPNLLNVTKLSGITNIAINALDTTRFKMNILVVIFLRCLFLQIT